MHVYAPVGVTVAGGEIGN